MRQPDGQRVCLGAKGWEKHFTHLLTVLPKDFLLCYLPRESSPLGFVFSVQISKTMILQKQEDTKCLFAVTYPPAAPTKSNCELQETLWSSQSTQGHPWSQRQHFEISSQAVLFTMLSLINCVYSGAVKDGLRSANTLPRKIFSTEVIVIKSDGKHRQKLTEKQRTHLSEDCRRGKKETPTLAWLRVHGGWTTCNKKYKNLVVRATTWFSKQLCGAHVTLQANWRGDKQESVLWGCTESREHTFTLSDAMPRPAKGSPSPAGIGPAAIVERPPSLGRKRKSALNQCISKEVSGKNTSAARMLSDFFFFLNKSYLLNHWIGDSRLEARPLKKTGTTQIHLLHANNFCWTPLSTFIAWRGMNRKISMPETLGNRGTFLFQIKDRRREGRKNWFKSELLPNYYQTSDRTGTLLDLLII